MAASWPHEYNVRLRHLPANMHQLLGYVRKGVCAVSELWHLRCQEAGGRGMRFAGAVNAPCSDGNGQLQGWLRDEVWRECGGAVLGGKRDRLLWIGTGKHWDSVIEAKTACERLGQSMGVRMAGTMHGGGHKTDEHISWLLEPQVPMAEPLSSHTWWHRGQAGKCLPFSAGKSS